MPSSEKKGGKKLAQLYDTLSFIFRYWFLFLAAMMLLLLVLNSRAEYRERKAVMAKWANILATWKL